MPTWPMHGARSADNVPDEFGAKGPDPDSAEIKMAIPAYAATGIIMRRRKTHNFRQSRMFAEFVTHPQTPLGFGDASRAEGASRTAPASHLARGSLVFTRR